MLHRPFLFRSAVVLLLTAAFAGSARAEDRLLRLLPPDTLGVAVIESVPELVRHWEAGPFTRLFQDEAVKRYFAPMQEEGKEAPWDEAAKKSTGHTLRENLEVIKGSIVLAVMKPASDQAAEFFGDEPPRLLMLGEIGPDRTTFEAFQKDELEATKAEAEEGEDYEETTEEYLGETLHLRRKVTKDGEKEEVEGWAVVGEIAVAAQPHELLRETVSKLKHPPEEASVPADLIAHRARAGAADLTFFLDLTKLAPVWKAWAQENLAEQLKNNPFGVTVDALIKGLALENATSLTISAAIAPEKTAVDFSLAHTGKSGVLSLLSYSNGPLATPSFVPANVVQAATGRYSFAKLWDNLFGILKDVSPGLSSMVNAQLEQLQQTVGVNIRKDILGGLGENLVHFQDLRQDGSGKGEPQEEVLYAVSLTNRRSVETALETIRNFLGQGLAAFEEKDLLGTKVYSYKMPFTAPAGDEDEEGADTAAKTSVLPVEITHAVTEHWLLIGVGTTRPMERALSAMNTPAATVWELPVVKPILEAAGDSLASFEYSNLSSLFPFVLQALNAAQSEAEEEEQYINPAATPEASVFAKYIGVTTTAFREEPGAFYSHSVLRASGSND